MLKQVLFFITLISPALADNIDREIDKEKGCCGKPWIKLCSLEDIPGARGKNGEITRNTDS